MDILYLNRTGKTIFTSEAYSAFKGQKNWDIDFYSIGAAYNRLCHMFSHGDTAACNKCNTISYAPIYQIGMDLTQNIFDKPGLSFTKTFSISVGINMDNLCACICKGLNTPGTVFIQSTFYHNYQIRELFLNIVECLAKSIGVIDFYNSCVFTQMTIILYGLGRQDRNNTFCIRFKICAPGF